MDKSLCVGLDLQIQGLVTFSEDHELKLKGVLQMDFSRGLLGR